MDFSFISDEQFRNSLVSDYTELNSCADAGSWKAVQVLAGSIVEALLVEYLSSSGSTPAGKSPLSLTLDEAIRACQSAGVIQNSTASLCDVVRDYRNLIHPGRMIRLQQQVSPETAKIAANLVALITREVALKRKETYGPTAEQIVKKVVSDRHALAVIPQLLSETNESERYRLVSSILPDAYREEDTIFSNDEALERLRTAYRQAHNLLPKQKKGAIAEKFTRMIREDSTEQIVTYGDAFFISEDIADLRPQDATIAITYLRGRLEEQSSSPTDGLIRSTAGLANCLPESQISGFSDTIIRMVLRQRAEPLFKKAKDLAWKIYDQADDARKRVMERRIRERIEQGKKLQYAEATLNKLNDIDVLWTEIPF